MNCLKINKNHLKVIDKRHRMLYGFCGAVCLSAISFCCAGLKAEVPTSALGGLDLDVSSVVYAIGSLSSAVPIQTLINISHIFPSTDAADQSCVFQSHRCTQTTIETFSKDVLLPILKRSITISSRPSRRGRFASVITLTSSRPYCATSLAAIKISHMRTLRMTSHINKDHEERQDMIIPQ